MHLEKLAAETASSISDYGSLIGHNLIFGAIVGIGLGLIRYKRLRSNDGLQWMLEMVVSPTGYSALRFGFSCLALHVSISMAIAQAQGTTYISNLGQPLDSAAKFYQLTNP